MADSKITALSTLDRFTLAPTDTTVAVDISDTTMAASGTNFEVELAELVASGAIGVLGLIRANVDGMLRYHV
jgi:hypothetical protein